MMLAADLSARMNWLNAADLQRLQSLLVRAKLPINAPNIGAARYLELMANDKKVESGQIRLVLQQGIGKAVITSDYDAEQLQKTLENIS
jgi:3-dehydroquinate synthetase